MLGQSTWREGSVKQDGRSHTNTSNTMQEALKNKGWIAQETIQRPRGQHRVILWYEAADKQV